MLLENCNTATLQRGGHYGSCSGVKEAKEVKEVKGRYHWDVVNYQPGIGLQNYCPLTSPKRAQRANSINFFNFPQKHNNRNLNKS